MSRRRLNPRMVNAIEELKTMIRERYPDAQFEVTRDPDDSRSILLETIVDIDETEDVLDLVLNRVLDLQAEDRLPIHVIPMWPRERTIAEFKRSRAAQSSLEKTTSAVP